MQESETENLADLWEARHEQYILAIETKVVVPDDWQVDLSRVQEGKDPIVGLFAPIHPLSTYCSHIEITTRPWKLEVEDMFPLITEAYFKALGNSTAPDYQAKDITTLTVGKTKLLLHKSKWTEGDSQVLLVAVAGQKAAFYYILAMRSDEKLFDATNDILKDMLEVVFNNATLEPPKQILQNEIPENMQVKKPDIPKFLNGRFSIKDL